MKPPPETRTLEIDGIRYLTATDLGRGLGVSRQTLWRWRQDGKIPPGHRYRARQLVFTEEEARAVREYANRLEPARVEAVDQLSLFNGLKEEETK